MTRPVRLPGLTPRTRDGVTLVALALVPFLLFWEETLGRRVFYHHDLQYYFLPYHKLVVDITRQGWPPLWNPYAFSGIPLLGDGQTAIFYPPSWLFWLFPAWHALTLSILVHFSLAGVGMFLYVRRIGLGYLAALVAALAFMGNGFLVAHLVHASIMAGAALIPLLFWGVERWLQAPTPGRFVLAAALIGLQALAGHPQTPVYTAVALGLYVLVTQLATRPGLRPIIVRLTQFALLYGVGYSLAAVQLVPWIDFARFSPRAAAASYDLVTVQSLVDYDWLLLLFPYGFGGLVTSWRQSLPAFDLLVYTWERLVYVGILPLALALVGLFDLRRHWRAARATATPEIDVRASRLIALAVVLVVMLLVAAGRGTPFGPVVYALPVIGKLRAYARAGAVVCFALAALAAYGVERLASREKTRRWDRVPLVAGLLVLGVTVAGLLVMNVLRPAFLSVPTDPWLRVLLDQGLRLDQANATVPLALASASLVLLLWASRGLNQVNAVLMVALVALDTLGLAATFNPTLSPVGLDATPPSVAFLRQDPSAYRVAVFVENDRLMPTVAQNQLAISWALAYGIEDVNGFNSLQPRRYTDFLFGTAQEDVSYGFLHDPRLVQPGDHRLTLLNVKYVLVQPDSPVRPDPSWREVYRDTTITVYQNPEDYGRVLFADSVAVDADPQGILRRVTAADFQPQRQSWLEADLDAAALERLGRGERAEVSAERLAPHEWRLRTETTGERLLVLSEMWFPGWEAEAVDDATGQRLAVPVYRTNYLFQGLVVPPGRQTIHLVYRPRSVWLGALVSGLTVLGCALALRKRGART